MSNDEILEANKLIAEFMEVKFSETDFTDDETFGGNADAVRYHRDWGWLMPVIEKIESGGYCVFIQNDCCWIKVGRAGMKMPYITNLSDSKIESTYKSCVEIIKWIKSKVLAEM